MKTTFRIAQPYQEIFLKCAEEFVNPSPARPERFIRKMKENTGMAGAVFGFADEDGLEKKNPLIAAIGDSVTAGHFEALMTEEIKAKMGSIFAAIGAGEGPERIKEIIEKMGGVPAVEVYDARESYIEKFRTALIDKYEYTSVSVINSGIAGDHLISMMDRLERDVLRYSPDLVLINGSLNWDDTHFGDADYYKTLLQSMVRRIKETTDADIILLTPNGDLPNTLLGDAAAEPTTALRAEKIREVAAEENVCLADVRAVWDAAEKAGCPWEKLLANGINHPSVEGHEVYAKVLMKLFE
ncbi:MAG: SGNH/GDSL hydrolase family protein [Eubacteriales bacterium]|nr:SGNH/GDSL hydrolase family protein [Eubacteriales bacterium]